MKTTLAEIYRFPSVTLAGIPAGSLETTCHLRIESVERFSAATSPRSATSSMPPRAGQEVYIVSPDRGRNRAPRSNCSGRPGWPRPGDCIFAWGTCGPASAWCRNAIALVSGSELFHRTDLHRTARRKLGRVIDSFLELREGDYVVHLSHGIGRYRGLKLLEKEGQVEEHLMLEFQGETKIYVPASKIELVQKYVGGAKSQPTLAKIGGRSWMRQKEAAEEAVNDLAGRHAATCRPRGPPGRASASPPTRPGSRNSTPRFPTAKRATS